MNKAKETTESQDQKHQRSVKKTVLYVLTFALLVVVVVAFVGAPVVGGMVGGSRLAFGSYDGVDIIYQPGNFLARQYADLAEQVKQSQQTVTDSVVRQIWRGAFDRTVFHLAMLATAQEAGLGVSQTAVDRAVATWPEFQENGRFSSAAYQNISAQAKFELREYLNEVLVDQQVRNDLFGNITLSESEKAFLVGLSSPERQFRFVQFGYDQYPEEAVLTYALENARRFQKINLSVITVSSSEADAQSIREQAVNRTSSFEDLARNQSRDVYAEEGGDMGWTYYHELEPDFEDITVIDEIFALQEGEVSRVFRATFGWTIYRVDEAPVNSDFTDPEVLGDVRDYMTVFERGRIEDYLSAQADGFVAAAREADFASAAGSYDQLPQLTSFFPVNYGNIPYFGTVRADSNATFAEAAYREDFLKQAFALQEGEVSDPVVIRNYVFVLQLADEREAEESSLQFLDIYMNTIVQQLTGEEVQRAMVDDDKLTDQFNAAYNRTILGN